MDSVCGIRVHNMGAFGMTFNLHFANGAFTHACDNSFAEGTCMTISSNNRGSYFPLDFDTLDGLQVWPSADIQSGVTNHQAGDNCIFDSHSSYIGVYNISGGCWNPSFSYQGVSTDPE